MVDKPAGRRRAPGARAPRRARSCRRWPAASPAATIPGAPGIVHRLDRDTSGLLRASRARRGRHAALRPRCCAARGRARVPGARRGPPAGARGDDRRAARPRPPRAHADVDRHRRAARGGHALRGRARAARRHAAARAPARPAARTRSARTCRRSATRWPATPSTGTPGCSASSASSCTPRGSRSRTRSRARRWTCARRCRTTCAARSGERKAWAGEAAFRAAPPAGSADRATGGRGREPGPHPANVRRDRRVAQKERRPNTCCCRRRTGHLRSSHTAAGRALSYLVCARPEARGSTARAPTHAGCGRARRIARRVRRQARTTLIDKGSTTVAEVGIKELLEAGVHFGHQTRRWNPKMRRFIFGERGGIYIIDLLKTEALLEQAQDVRRRGRAPRRHRPVRGDQEAGARRRQGDRRGGRHAVRQPPLARRPADELPDDLAAHQAPARPRALRGRGPARSCCRRASAWPPRPTSRSCGPTSAA